MEKKTTTENQRGWNPRRISQVSQVVATKTTATTTTLAVDGWLRGRGNIVTWCHFLVQIKFPIERILPNSMSRRRILPTYTVLASPPTRRRRLLLIHLPLCGWLVVVKSIQSAVEAKLKSNWGILVHKLTMIAEPAQQIKVTRKSDHFPSLLLHPPPS